MTWLFFDSMVSFVSEELNTKILILINQGEKTQEILVKEFGKTRVGFCKQVTFTVIKIPMLLMIILINYKQVTFKVIKIPMLFMIILTPLLIVHYLLFI